VPQPASKSYRQYLLLGRAAFETPRAETAQHAYAKSGDAATISGYLGKSDTFADQNEKDHAALVVLSQNLDPDVLMMQPTQN
jgi:cytochrome c-type biogenesis protein CcmH/NrfG